MKMALKRGGRQLLFGYARVASLLHTPIRRPLRPTNVAANIAANQNGDMSLQEATRSPDDVDIKQGDPSSGIQSRNAGTDTRAEGARVARKERKQK
jgi:hypothetical protein